MTRECFSGLIRVKVFLRKVIKSFETVLFVIEISKVDLKQQCYY